MWKKRPEQSFDIEEEGEYTAILSSHDLCAIEFLDKLTEAGVSSFKIEGRMKTPYYVATVTDSYRKAIDRTYPINELREQFDCISHRPYSSGFYFGEMKRIIITTASTGAPATLRAWCLRTQTARG